MMLLFLAVISPVPSIKVFELLARYEEAFMGVGPFRKLVDLIVVSCSLSCPSVGLALNLVLGAAYP